jgi:ABC-type branched-subunit amino acid transport system substrate-binding protein
MAVLLALLIAPRADAAQGVMTHEIVVGAHLDLSGPLALQGEAAWNGLRMGIDEANAAGGMNGKRIRLVVEDNRYDAGTAASAVRKLVREDRVFAILSPLGTPAIAAGMPEALNHGALHLFPMSADAQNYLPLHRLKFAMLPSYSAGITAGLNALLDETRARKIAVLYQANTFGLTVLDGAQMALASHKLTPAEVLPYPPGTRSFSRQITSLKAAKIDIVVLGSVVQDTVAIMRAARARGFRPVFLCSSACYTPETATLGSDAVEGLYAVAATPIPYRDNSELGTWARRYERKFGIPPSIHALQAYLNVRLFADAVRKTGAVLTQTGLAQTLESMGPWSDPTLGGISVTFSPQDHLGIRAGLLSRVRNGRWVAQAVLHEARTRPENAKGARLRGH